MKIAFIKLAKETPFICQLTDEDAEAILHPPIVDDEDVEDEGGQFRAHYPARYTEFQYQTGGSQLEVPNMQSVAVGISRQAIPEPCSYIDYPIGAILGISIAEPPENGSEPTEMFVKLYLQNVQMQPAGVHVGKRMRRLES